jgi:hypothetical protein
MLIYNTKLGLWILFAADGRTWLLTEADAKRIGG